MKYLNMLGRTGLYILMYLIANLISSFVMGIFYALYNNYRMSVPEIEAFIMENLHINMILASVITLLLLSAYLFFRRKSPLAHLNFNAVSFRTTFTSALLGIGIALTVNSLFGFLDMNRLFPEGSEMLREITVTGNIVIRLLSVGLVAPILEEVLFRGAIFKELLDHLPVKLALLIQALLFGIIHGNLLQFIYVLFAGIFLGLVYLWSASIIVPILVHVFWNSFSVISVEVLPAEITIVANTLLLILGLLIITKSSKSIKKVPVN